MLTFLAAENLSFCFKINKGNAFNNWLLVVVE